MQQEANNKITKIIIATITFLIVCAMGVFTFITVQGRNTGGASKTGKYIIMEFDGTKFKLGDSYGEIIREIAAQRPIYNWGGVFGNNYTEVKDIDAHLNILVSDATTEKVNVVLRAKGATVPGLFIGVGKDQEDIGKDKTTKLEDAHTRLIVYSLGEKNVVTFDGFVLDSEKTTGKEFKEYFGADATPYYTSEDDDGETTFYMYYKNRYVMISFGSNKHTFSGLEITDYRLY